jgi:hypothetical protein
MGVPSRWIYSRTCCSLLPRWSALPTRSAALALAAPALHRRLQRFRAAVRSAASVAMRPARQSVFYSPNTYSTVALRCSLSSGMLSARGFASGLRPEAIATLPAVELEGHRRRREGGADIDLPQFIACRRRPAFSEPAQGRAYHADIAATAVLPTQPDSRQSATLPCGPIAVRSGGHPDLRD